MIILPQALSFALRANHATARASDAQGVPFDPPPLLKLFNPLSAATWLATELDADEDRLFGLADLGFGCPELGYFSLREIMAVHLPFGLKVERDFTFSSEVPLSHWADTARRCGSILVAELELTRAARAGPPPDG